MVNWLVYYFDFFDFFDFLADAFEAFDDFDDLEADDFDLRRCWRRLGLMLFPS